MRIMFPLIILTIWFFIWLLIQFIIVEKEKIALFKKILDNSVFNIVVVISWVVIIIILIPFSSQILISGDLVFILDLLGQILVILGILNFIWLFFQKRGVGAQEMGKLLTKGAYGVSRHPIYLSHMLIYCGLVFERGAFEALIIFPLIIIIYIITAKIEEKFSIGKTYKDEYDIYRKQVPMFMKWWLFLIFCSLFITFLVISVN
ncbi:MAG: DUF1295 domain-containing protein, partial [Promethearchaeota archaeon]